MSLEEVSAAVPEPEPTAVTTEEPYWASKNGIAPIKAQYVQWEKIRSHSKPDLADIDDAAEGRTSAATTAPPKPVTDERPAPSEGKEESNEAKEGQEGAVPEKKQKLSGAQKRREAKERSQREWKEKQERKKAAAAGGQTGDVEGGDGSGLAKRQRGQNKNRQFDHQAGVALRLCTFTSKGEPCARPEGSCKWSHDLPLFFASQLPEILISLPTDENNLSDRTETARVCPLWSETGTCPFGFKCRYLSSHLKRLPEGEGFQGSGFELVEDEQKKKEWAERNQKEFGGRLNDRGELNVVSMDRIKELRGAGKKPEERFPMSAIYMKRIGEVLDNRGENANGRGGKGGKGQKRNSDGELKPAEVKGEATVSVATGEGEKVEHLEVVPVAQPPTEGDAEKMENEGDALLERKEKEQDLSKIRLPEKKKLDFKDKLYLAPLTTVGNLPFRRLCVSLGCDITCSEMGLAQEFLGGNNNEWSLVRRHPSEKMFGVQICGSKPQILVPAAETIIGECEIDFLDINCGCPIDLVFNKGAGSALLGHAGKLGRSLAGMSEVLGETPLTIKIRNGIQHNSPVAHKLVQRMQGEWGVSAVTLHGRSRQQRYKTKADYQYVGEVARQLRQTASDLGQPSIPIFGNGDAYDYRTYYENMETSGVDGIMVARGGLVKPWIFTEIKEKRDWDISSRERLDLIGQLASFGLEHWGSDTQGVNITRRFLLESLSFTHRYVPVGLLERFPVSLNERPFPYRGRDELETLLASDQADDWIKISSMFLGPPPDDWVFTPKHKANASAEEIQG
ncbi:FMN-linked oxidoreductase [Meredithblackwellia eburnea MCA 4105]